MKSWQHGSFFLVLALSSTMKPWMNAWMLGTISGLSLPLGALLGIYFSPVRDEVCASWMALGAGSLLFAVTVELYGHALRELEMGRAGLLEMFATVVGALCGALFYLWVNRLLEEMMADDAEDAEQADCSNILDRSQSPTESTPLHNTRSTPLHNLSKMTTPSHGHHSHPNLRDDSFSKVSYGSWAGSDNEFATINARSRDKVMKRMARSGGDQSARSQGQLSTRSHISTPGSESSVKCDPETAAKCKHVAFALFLGILVDGVPEGILMGFLAAEGHLSWVLVFSLLVANFPEAFSSASLMRQGGESKVKIVGMWGGLCLLVGALAGIACFGLMYFFPSYPHGDLPQGCLLLVSLVEGITGGAMIACIATVMLPEAFQRAGKHGALCASSGFLCTAGFLVAVVLKALEHHYNHTHGEVPGIHGDDPPTHAFYLPGFGYW